MTSMPSPLSLPCRPLQLASALRHDRLASSGSRVAGGTIGAGRASRSPFPAADSRSMSKVGAEARLRGVELVGSCAMILVFLVMALFGG